MDRLRQWHNFGYDKCVKDALRLLEAVIIVLLAVWIVGVFLHWLGWLIHIVLVIALIALVFRFLQGRSPSQ